MASLRLAALSRLRWFRPLLLIVPIALLLIALRQGIGLDWDAVVYLSAAESFADTGQLTSYSGQQLTTFAPGLPTLLGVLLTTGADFNVIGVVIAVVAVATTMVCTYAVAKEVLGSVSLAWTAVALVGFSVSTVRVFAMLKTEAIFTALVMSTLALCLWAIRSGRTPLWWMVSVAATAATATTFRYIGFTLIPMTALAALLATWPSIRWRSVGRAALTGVASSAGLLLVAYRNVHLGAPPLGPRLDSELTAQDVLTDTLHVLGSYIVPSDDPGTLQMLSGCVIVGLLVLGAVAALRHRSVPASILCIFVCGFTATLLYSEFTTVIEPVSERLLAPAFPAIAILAVAGVSWLCEPPTNHADRHEGSRVTFPKIIAVGVLAVVVVTSLFSSVRFSFEAGHKGLGYNSVAHRTSPTAKAARELPPTIGVAAMNGPRTYMATRRTPIHFIPMSNRFYPSNGRRWAISRLKAQVASGRVGYLVYFKKDKRAGVVSPKELAASGLKLREVAQFPDGAIWAPAGRG